MLNENPNPEDHGPEDHGIESLLAGFAPQANAIDRERMMFLAGYRAAKEELASVAPRVGSRLWPAIAFASAATAIGMGVLLWRQPPRVEWAARAPERPTEAESPPKVAFLDPPSAASVVDVSTVAANLRLREQLLRGELPEPALRADPQTKSPPPTPRELYMELLPEFRGVPGRANPQDTPST